ncbi:hypothetical protein ON010_g12442 [Phytophthora cinnamomi]|nr:hypothetical protein ON010_g12442 [Phytophthora cinnamomi]
MSKRRIAPDGGTVAQLGEVASFLCPSSHQPVGSQTIHRELLSSKRSQNKISHRVKKLRVVSPTTRTASSAPDGAGSAEPGVGAGSSAPNDGRSSSNECEDEEDEEEEAEKQAVDSSSLASQQGPSAGISKSLQALNVDRASALQAQGHLPSGQGSSSRKPSAFSFLVEQPSDVTVRVVGVPATEKHNDGKTFLQVGLGGREASVLMERLGASELVHLYDFFEDNDVVGDYILTPRENPLTESGLTSQLESFAVKRELTSILTQFDAKQLAYRMFGTVSLLRKMTAKYDRIKRRLAEDEDDKANVDLQD